MSKSRTPKPSRRSKASANLRALLTQPSVLDSAKSPDRRDGDKEDRRTSSISHASAAERKAAPIASGFLDYFPDACAEVARLSKIGNDQHNPGQPLHWARGKSTDEADCILRHLIDRGTIDGDGVRHATKVAWRAMALLQKEIEKAEGLPISRGSTA